VEPKIIAFYFPQFHRILENDMWWGEGYTEWLDVRRAKPRFDGHLQPRLPTTLGYYDLLDTRVQERQAELALDHGVFGFCYYHYWFGGRKLLEKPIENMLANPNVRIPFCICYANESWTRAWEGSRDKVLIRQEHSEPDDRAFLQSLVPFFRDPRYIRTAGKPLLLVYRTELFPNAKRTAEIWREEARRQGVGEIYLCRCESYFDLTDPAELGFDAAYEFPPHSLRPAHREVKRDSGFDGGVFDFPACVDDSLRRAAKEARNYKRFRGVMTGFDNTPKMQTRSWVFLDSSPLLYQEWLMDALRETVEKHTSGEQFVFVNAWNEWAEGAILEPCSQFGDGYLKATASALRAFQ
jgi:lipopolysaccharide biosynthesis protein